MHSIVLVGMGHLKGMCLHSCVSTLVLQHWGRANTHGLHFLGKPTHACCHSSMALSPVLWPCRMECTLLQACCAVAMHASWKRHYTVRLHFPS